MVIVFVAAGLCMGVLVGAIFGWQYSVIGLGAALGPWIGGYVGNKKACEVDKYRDELIRGRKSVKPDDDQSVDFPFPRCGSHIRDLHGNLASFPRSFNSDGNNRSCGWCGRVCSPVNSVCHQGETKMTLGRR
jgi:hypothetical protein